MNKVLICLFFLAFPLLLFSQKPYFQQEVNTTIAVTLDDQLHQIEGEISMEYTNHSPDVLDEIWIHLWANAFKNRTTAFAKQNLASGSTRFYFADSKWRGNYAGLAFEVNGKSVPLEYDPKNPDIAVLKLNEPLQAKGKITIRTPFTLKIPASFSRLGHVQESYQMTQWYPKPAVYDRNGWHPMPYLDMGEFYYEFGSYDVSITLPANYVVAATGELQTESEKVFLQKRIEESNSLMSSPINGLDTFPASSPQMKTIRYTANDVHDFAWFADKRFYVQKSEVKLASGKKVDTWAFFNNAEGEMWKKGTFYVDRAVEFYSDKVGEYPWPQATAVQSALSAGGGMEYPMITVIGLSGTPYALDQVITHEVGHNWFYGILAFNERDHAWMDEGLNSYYDHRYTQLYYPGHQEEILPKFFTKGSDMNILEIAYLFQARRNIDQAPETHSTEFSPANYYLSAYEKPARFFEMLEEYLGVEEYDRIMKGFYEKWKFKHPLPEDFKAYVSSESSKELGWLFDGLINSNGKIDYALKGLSKKNNYQVTVENKGDLSTPFSLSGLKDSAIVNTQWYEGFEGGKKVDFPDGDYDRIVIDAQHHMLDINRQNNNIKTSGAFKTIEPLRFKFLGGIEHSNRTTLYWSPLVTYNTYDKATIGLALYNSLFPVRNFEFALAPLYSFETSDLVGLAAVRYNIFPKTTKIHSISLGLNAKSFNYNYIPADDYHLKYRRLVPSIKVEFGRKPGKKVYQTLEFRTLLLDEELAVRDTDGVYLNNEWDLSTIHELKYTLLNNRAINPFSLELGLEQQSYTNFRGDQNYLKAWLEWKSAYTYARNRNIDFRIFLGGFLQNTQRNAGSVSTRQLARGSFSLVDQGFTDYKYDGLFVGRNEADGFWSRQIQDGQGNLKTAFGRRFGIGQSNNFIASLNIKADLPQDLPLHLPLKPYLDLGYYDNATPLGSDATFKDQLLVSGGVMLDFIDGAFAIYFPLFNSDNVKMLHGDLEGGKYWGRITYNLDLTKFNAWKLADRIEF